MLTPPDRRGLADEEQAIQALLAYRPYERQEAIDRAREPRRGPAHERRVGIPRRATIPLAGSRHPAAAD